MKVFIETLGCEKNTADSESAAGILEAAGHEIVKDPSVADAVMVNTCGFINDAKEESINRIFDMKACKKEGALLLVSGCLSQRYEKALYKQMPEVDIFLGVNDYQNLPEILAAHENGQREMHFSTYEKQYLELGFRKRMEPSYSASIKIAEGCDNVCAYCIIPFIRGGYRSRRQEDILKEAEMLVAEGCRELILIAQDVTAYGMDFDGAYHLPELITRLSELEGVRWIRLMYCYEDRITDELIHVIATNKKVCHYIDIPIQHGSDVILSAMNRHSTKASIKNTIKKLRQAVPDIHIRTTLITGFPGEGEKEFEELCDFVNEMKFERLGVFHYSKEEGTKAATMKGQVREQTKIKRKDVLLSMQREISFVHNQKKIEQILEVLVEEQEEEGTYVGRSAWDAPEIDNSVVFTSKNPLRPGDFVQVKIQDAFDYDLIGEKI